MLVAHRAPYNYPHPAWDVMMIPTAGRFSAGVSFVGNASAICEVHAGSDSFCNPVKPPGPDHQLY